MNSIQKADLSKLNKDNKFIVDWLSFSCTGFTVDDLLSELGIDNLIYSELPGCQGYMKRKYFEGININYEPGIKFHRKVDVETSNRVWVEISGKGCRNFETFSNMTCWELLTYIYKNSDIFTVNRIDIAYDVFDKTIDLDDLVFRCRNHLTVTRYKPTSLLCESLPIGYGLCQNLGSKRSDIMFRVYDKALERGYFEEVSDGSISWIRWEMQLRHKRCDSFLEALHDDKFNIIPKVGELFKGILLNYFRPVVPSDDDTNKSRWKSPDWFTSFIGNVEKCQLYVKADAEYNLEKCERFIYNKAGNALRTLVEIKGADKVLQELQENKPDKVPNKYQELLNYHKCDDSDALTKIKVITHKLFIVTSWIKLFEVRAVFYCEKSLADAFLKVANTEYTNIFAEYTEQFKRLSKKNQEIMSDLFDDDSYNGTVHIDENVFISYLKRYSKTVFFADNLYVDCSGLMCAADTNSKLWEFLI